MPRNGSGGTTQPASSIYPASPNTTIESAKANNSIADIYTMIADSLAKDGQTTATARIPFAAGISVDDIDEKTAGAGVNVDGLVIKDGGIADTNGNEAIKVATTAVAVNEITVTNAAAGGEPSIAATGDDTDIDLVLVSKGAGFVTADDSDFAIRGSADATKKARFEVDGLTTGNTRVLHAPDQDSGVGLVLGTEQASTSGSAVNFTGIPSWVKRITVMFDAVSTNGTQGVSVQIGDSGGLETTAYASGATRTTISAVTDGGVSNNTNGFFIATNSATQSITGALVLTLMDSANNTWIAHGVFTGPSTNTYFSAGSKSLSATLDRVSVITADTFDAGAINILYE